MKRATSVLNLKMPKAGSKAETGNVREIKEFQLPFTNKIKFDKKESI